MPEPNQTVTPEQKPDLITRVAQVKTETKESSVTEPEFDYKEIESIKDPVAKEIALKAYKSFQRGFNQKFQDIASLRKDLENKSQEFSNWTPERIQKLINDPKFVEAAKSVVGTQTEEQPYETEADKELKVLKEKVRQLEGQTIQQTFKQQDEQISKKYANYNPQKVDEITADMLSGKVQATREHLWKVLDYESAVERAYQLGKEDRKLEMGEKHASASFDTNTTITTNGEKTEPLKGESDRSYLQRLFAKNAQRK